jgi:hypothetical protein
MIVCCRTLRSLLILDEGVITFVILPTLFLLDNRFPAFSNRFGSLTPRFWLGIYGAYTVLWAAAIGSSVYSCSDLCSACGNFDSTYVIYAGKCCDCPSSFGTSEPFCKTQASQGINFGTERRHYWYEAAQGLDSAVM